MAYTPEQIAAHIEQRAASAGEDSADVRILRQLVTGWQPLETAPRDRTVILCILAGNHPSGRAFVPAVVRWDFGEWRDPDNDFQEPETAFTHWMPLPTPPQETPQ